MFEWFKILNELLHNEILVYEILTEEEEDK